MSPTRGNKTDLRVTIDKDLLRLLRSFAGISQRSVSSLTQQAIEEFLAKEENQVLIEHHRLDEEIDTGDSNSA
jgi:predicted transcriptional regulator